MRLDIEMADDPTVGSLIDSKRKEWIRWVA
jgi:hypothetical protein